MKRRKRLILHQSLASRQGQIAAGWHVGYWDAAMKGKPADVAFRSFGLRPTQAEAIELAKQVAASRNKEFVF